MGVAGKSGTRWPLALAVTAVGGLMALVGGCSRETDLPAAEEPSQSSGATTVFAREAHASGVDPELAGMFVAAFGEQPPATVRAPTGGRESLLQYKPVAAIRAGSGRILISEGETEDCHGCFGRLAIHYLTVSKGGFVVSRSWPHFVIGNGWGKPPDWNIRRDLMPNPVIEVRTHFGNQGYDCDWISLVELTSTKPIVRLPTTVAGYDNTGAVGDSVGEKTTAVVVPGPPGGLSLRYRGSRAGQINYAMVDGEYEARGVKPLKECAAE